jgi:hypothetical protein
MRFFHWSSSLKSGSIRFLTSPFWIVTISTVLLLGPWLGQGTALAATRSFTTTAVVQPTTAAAGSTVMITASVSSQSTTNVSVDVKVNDATGSIAYEQRFDKQGFAAGQTRTYSVSFPIPSAAPAGTYTVQIAVLAPNGNAYAWNASAAVFTVTSSGPSPVPAATTSPIATATPTSVPATSTPVPTASASPTATAIPTAATSSAATLRLDAGSTSAYVGYNGNIWPADNGYVDGNTVARGNIAIANTADPQLYQDERYGLTGYNLAVPNGTYTVRLYFAETFSGVTSPGQRVFNVGVQGQSFLQNFDVYAAAGGWGTALVETTTASVTNGQLAISFAPLVQNTMIDAIEVLPGTTNATAIPVATPGASPTATAIATAVATATRVATVTPVATVSATPPPASGFGPDWTAPSSPPPTASQNLQSLIDAAPSGSTLLVPAGTYRQAVSINKPLTLDGQRAAWIVGSNLIGGIETPARPTWLSVNSDSVTIKNFVMKYSTTALYDSAFTGWAVNNITISNNWLGTTNNGAIVGFGGGTGYQFLHNDLGLGGEEGFTMSNVTNVLYQYNRIHDNNTTRYNYNDEAGGGKIVHGNSVTWDHNDVYGNYGPGLWCDIACNGVTYSNNRIHNNVRDPIFNEISDNASIHDNVIWDSAGYGSVNVASDGHVDVYNNLVARSPSFHVALEGRADQPADAGTFITVHDNRIIAASDGVAVSWQGTSANTNGNTDTNNVILTGTAATNAMIAAGIPLQ